ncbi:MAG: MCE family protein [Actinobacteria bacterium]|nr:MCE family protein [Actinomycetota bacterium]
MIRTLIRLVIFTLVCMTFTLWLAFTIGNIRSVEVLGVRLWGADRYGLSATFDDVTGLLLNDNVKVAGVVVGKVTGISVEKGQAVVDFELDQDVKLSSDTETAVRWRNLLGQRYLYLYPGEASTVLESGDAIPAQQARPIIDLGELFNRLGPILQSVEPEKVNEFLVAFTGALEGGNVEVLGDAVGDLGTFAQALGSRDEAIGRMVENLAELTDALATRDTQLRTILDNVTELATTFNENSAVLESTVVDLGAFSDALGRLISENRPGIDRIITRVADVVGVVDEKLTTLENTVAGLDELGSALFRASRYGEWLNQFIPCMVIDVDGPSGPIPPVNNTSACTSQGASSGQAASAPPSEVATILGELVDAGGTP